MRLLEKLEKKIGWLAIPNLMLFIITGNVIVYCLEMLMQVNMTASLSFFYPAILKGEVWRVISFIFIPPDAFSGSIFGLMLSAIVFMFYYSIGRQLERAMGSFAFTMYYLVGMLGVIICGIIFPIPLTGIYLNSALFFAFAFYFPDQIVLFMMIIPVKIKYIALFSAAYMTVEFFLSHWLIKIVMATGLINFFLFFGKDLFLSIFGKKSTQSRIKRQHARKHTFRVYINPNPKPYSGSDSTGADFQTSATGVKHCCEVCGRTELSNPELEFRYCSQCEGYHEYCLEHLKDHTHKSQGEA